MYKIYIFMQKKLIRILARALHEYAILVLQKSGYIYQQVLVDLQ